ncbi:hypothetical protein ACH9EU_01565 [Kocuria sp. M1R5S2]|uniref:hypothetical protein n=1 Tax=Kocuria rhizosphaerae TaxID=3376285 RepID=UPI0037B71D56
MTVTATTQPTHATPREDHDESRVEDRGRSRSAPPAAPQPRSAAAGGARAAVDPGLLAVLRCPLTGGTLIALDSDRLMSDRPFRDGVHPVYPVVHGIPCLSPSR